MSFPFLEYKKAGYFSIKMPPTIIIKKNPINSIRIQAFKLLNFIKIAETSTPQIDKTRLVH